ncbi:MAG TPA: hemolysin family protein [Micromonosporaceae bacterium]|nr:hemolysin family protein [Micromonosporaceae bacterium]
MTIEAGAIQILLPLLAFLALTAANGFFVTAEFALVTVDRATVDHLAEGGDSAAVTIRKAVRELSFQLSGAQLGITITVLLTGYLAEPALAKLFAPAVRPFGAARDDVASILAFGLATLISMLFGELVPKNAAIARPLPMARRTAGPMRAFSKVFGWLIRALNGSANWLVRRLGIEPQEELASARSPEELGLLAAYSARAGALPAETALLLRRTIRFGEKRAAEAMTPRVDVIGVADDMPVTEVIELIRRTGKSRFPVYRETLDQIVGVVTVVQILAVPPDERSSTTAGEIAVEPVLVPESLDLDGVLATLRAAGADFAIVVDEYGGTDGVVSIEDLAEEVVGDIADEHDVVERLPSVAPNTVANGPAAEVTVPGAVGPWLVDGVLRADELEELTGFRLPEGPYETLAGFLMAELGRIPAPGDEVTYGGWAFTVIEVNRRRVEQVRVTGPAGDQT